MRRKKSIEINYPIDQRRIYREAQTSEREVGRYPVAEKVCKAKMNTGPNFQRFEERDDNGYVSKRANVFPSSD